jgi:outer membrane lipoprotein-sorting protein
VSGSEIHTIHTLTAFFSRSYTTQHQKEYTEGYIYLDNSGRMILRVTRPLEQWMMINNKTMQLYYPQSKQAFKIQYSSIFSLPFIQSFISTMENDRYFQTEGFSAGTAEKHGDSIVTHVLPPPKLKKLFKEIVVTTRNNKVIAITKYDAHGSLMGTITMSNYQSNGGYSYPLVIENTCIEKTGSSTEQVTFDKVTINKGIPDSIARQKIPLGTPIKDITW